MKIKTIIHRAFLAITIPGICSAASLPTNSQIYFRGAITYDTCAPNLYHATESNLMAFSFEQHCPLNKRASLNAQNITIEKTAHMTILNPSIETKLANIKGPRDNDESYYLVDDSGKRVTVGQYIVTITLP